MFHVSQDLLGATLVSTRGDRATIMACWLEEPADMAHRPQFTVLLKYRDGRCFKAYLPDTDWGFEVKET